MPTERRHDGQALTDREAEVVRLMAKGHTNGEIAELLGISFATAKTHVSAIIGKLGVDTREEAVEVWTSGRSLRARLRSLSGDASLGGSLLRYAAGAFGILAVSAVTIIGVSGRSSDTSADGGKDTVGTQEDKATTATPSLRVVKDGHVHGTATRILSRGNFVVTTRDSGEVRVIDRDPDGVYPRGHLVAVRDDVWALGRWAEDEAGDLAFIADSLEFNITEVRGRLTPVEGSPGLYEFVDGRTGVSWRILIASDNIQTLRFSRG